MVSQEKQLRTDIIDIGKRLYALRLVVGSSGNLSARVTETSIMVTATGASLGNLTAADIIRVHLDDEHDNDNKRLTSEFPLHRLIYKNFPHRAVIHCHPALTNGYFAVYADIKPLTFETKLYLGHIPVVVQDTPAVSRPECVIEALKLNNLVVLKNHGVVAVGKTFKDVLHLIEALEEAVRTVATARLFKKEILDDLDKEFFQTLRDERIYSMFSKEHIQAIVDLVNQDEFILTKGRELDLTLQLAIKVDDQNTVHKFTFEKGRITRLESDDQAPFVISAPADVWESVFLGKVEPFVATMQGKMKLKGDLGKLSRWYVPFSRLFELFKKVRIK
jgi:L-fuculose-phosphate aldolase